MRMEQTCFPVRTRSLPNGNLDSGYIDFLVHSLLNLRRRGGLKK